MESHFDFLSAPPAKILAMPMSYLANLNTKDNGLLSIHDWQ